VSLGQDFEQDALDAFSGDLNDATLTQQASSAYDIDDPTAAPTSTPVVHTCEGLAFTYARRDIDGTRVLKNDYRVVLLKGSLSVMPAAGDAISIPPPGSTVAVSARVIAVEAVTESQITVQVRGPA
jgi:hypothetical protein